MLPRVILLPVVYVIPHALAAILHDFNLMLHVEAKQRQDILQRPDSQHAGANRQQHPERDRPEQLVVYKRHSESEEQRDGVKHSHRRIVAQGGAFAPIFLRAVSR